MTQTNTAATGKSRLVRRVAPTPNEAVTPVAGSADAGPPALAPEPEPAADLESDPLPYGGDIQAAMKAQDRGAIAKIMQARDAKHTSTPVERTAAAGVHDGPSPIPRSTPLRVTGPYAQCFDCSQPLTAEELKEDCAVCYCPVGSDGKLPP